MDRDKFITYYSLNLFSGSSTSDLIVISKFIETVLLEYEKPLDKIKQLIEACLSNPFLLIEVFEFLKEKESIKYNLTILTNRQNQIIKVY